jgi:hypothetical protein
MIRLIRCKSCSRHLQVSEVACPFCGNLLEPTVDAPKPKLARGLSRAQRMAIIGALAAESLISCDATMVITPYGAPPPRPGGTGGVLLPGPGAGAGGGAGLAGSGGAEAGSHPDGGSPKR